jgi:hypothetical protein
MNPLPVQQVNQIRVGQGYLESLALLMSMALIT